MRATLIGLIPVYNEAGRISQVVMRLLPMVSRVIVVDDGSSDGSGGEAEAAGAEVLRHTINRGKGAALLTGLARCRQLDCDWVVLVDGDGQHDPKDIPTLLRAARDGTRLIVGNRFEQADAMPIMRRIGNRIGSIVVSYLCRQNIPDTQCGFRLVHRSLLNTLRLVSQHYECDSEMLLLAAHAGERIVSVPVRTIYAGETSHIRPLRDLMRLGKLLWRYRHPVSRQDSSIAGCATRAP